MFENLKNKIKNFTSYLFGYDKIFEEVEKKKKQAKNDKERIAILEEGLELSKEAIQKLATENADLRENLKEHEELESILSSGSSVSSSEGVDIKIDQNIKDLETLLLNSKKSTATIRKEIKLLKRIKKLKFLNYQKDRRIQELEEKQRTELTNLRNKVLKLKSSVGNLQGIMVESPTKNKHMTIDNELSVKELETIIEGLDTEMNTLLTQLEALKKKRKEAEDKLKEKTDKETKTSEALKVAKSKAELLKEKIKKAHEELKAEIETPPK